MAKPKGRKRGQVLSTLLPAKHPGRHRWIINAVYPLTDEQAAAVAGGAELNIDPERLLVPNLVCCLDCDLPHGEARMTACAADDQYVGLSWPSPNPQGES